MANRRKRLSYWHISSNWTLSIGTWTVTSMVVEVVRSIGPEFSGVAIVNGHGGNADALATAAHQCRFEGRSLAVWSPRIPGADLLARSLDQELAMNPTWPGVRVDSGVW